MVRYDVVILPSFAQAEAWCKRHADERANGLFAQSVTTFDAWIADLWELHGDGRALVSDMQRQVIMQSVFEDAGRTLSLSGIIPLACTCVRKASGVHAFEQALSDARAGIAIEGMHANEQALFEMIARYFDVLDGLGLVEPGTAAATIAANADRVFLRAQHVLMADAVPLTWIQRQFFESCPQVSLTVDAADCAEGVGQAPDGVRVRFAFPSGRTAEPGLIADIVCQCTDDKGVVVVCKNPLDMHERTATRLASHGFQSCAQASKPFALTDFGRAFLAMHRCLNENPWDPSALSDVLFSPFSGLSQADAFAFDAAVRADRIASLESVLAQLRIASESFSQLEELATDPDADVLIGVFEQLVQASAHRSAAWRAEQLAAMGALREAARAARRVGGTIGSCVAVLQRVMVSASTQVGDGPHVFFTTQPIAARMSPGCCALLVIADLTAEDYPVADKDDAASTLFSKIALDPEESALSRVRREFGVLLELPTGEVRLIRPLGDVNAEATYPSVVLEEFIDAYRSDPTATEDIDNPYRLPANLQDGLVERGEELLFANERADVPGAVQALSAEPSQPQLGDGGEEARRLVVPKRFDDQGQPLAMICPSPSQIEMYLECPYQWFATRRLRIDVLDEGFGPLERGTFAHAALERFYRRFQEAGQLKVTAKNLADAQSLMRAVLDELTEEQPSSEPKSGRLVAATELERRDLAAFCDQIVGYLDFEATLLPTFHPAYFEYKIELDQGVNYAGCPLVGMVDRIDVDDAGHAVIVDYKGSVNAEHEIAGKGIDHPGKVQTRIYARAVERALGLNVVGALYVSYGRKPAAAGAYDSRVLEAAHLPAMHHDKCSCGTLDQMPDPIPDDFSLADLSFECMLDITEQITEKAVSSLCAGNVAPNPAYPQACAYCPVLACPKRGA